MSHLALGTRYISVNGYRYVIDVRYPCNEEVMTHRFVPMRSSRAMDFSVPPTPIELAPLNPPAVVRTASEIYNEARELDLAFVNSGHHPSPESSPETEGYTMENPPLNQEHAQQLGFLNE